MRLLLTILIFSFSAQIQAQTTDEKAVFDTENRRFAAQVSKDVAVLEETLAPDMVYVHSTGVVDNKKSYINAIRSGKSNYTAVEPQEQTVRLYGNTAIVNGVCAVKMNNDNRPTEFKLRYTSVYLKNSRQWQLVSYQSLKQQ